MINRNHSGFAIMENLVAVGVAMIVGMALIGGLVSYRKMSQSVMIMSSTDKEINEIGENIRSNMDSFQVNYKFTNQAKEEALELKNLPMAWDVGINIPAEQCASCGGRYGFVIQPFEEYRGLYLVTLRMTHTSWQDPYRDYQFVVSAK